MRGEVESLREVGGRSGSSLLRFEWLGPLLLASLLLYLLTQVGHGDEKALLFLAAGVTAALGLLFFSLRNVYVPVLLWLLSVLGMRTFLVMQMPVLPDLTPDRVLLIYMLFVILLRMVLARQGVARLSWLDGLMIAHLVYLLVSCITTNSRAVNVWSRSYLMAVAAFFVGKAYFSNRRWLKRLFAVLLVANLYHAVTSIAEHFNITALIWPKYILDETIGFQDPGRSRGMFLQPGVLGVTLGMALPMHFYFMITTRNRLLRYLLLASVGLVAAGLFFTYTRTTWLATTAGLLALTSVGWKRYSARVMQFGGVAALLVFAGFISFRSDTFLQKRLKQEHTITGRINTLATAYRMFRDNPVFGVGLMNYHVEKANYREPINVPFYGLIRAQFDKTGNPHDIYVGAIAEEGLFGMTMQFAIYFLILSALLAHYRQPRPDDHLVQFFIPAVAACMVCYLVGGLGFDYRYFESLSSMFYVLAGAIVGYKPETA